jgi:hypothetical protein
MTVFRLIVAPLLLLTAASASAHQEDYPTHEVVEYVIGCMQEHGGVNYDNLYKCSCTIDAISEKMTHDEFVTADTFVRGRSAAGERPEILREGPAAEGSRENFQEILNTAERQCGLAESEITR